MVIEITEQEMNDIMYGGDYGRGFCTKCGADRYDCEPDAENYECEECGAMAVYGAEVALMLGIITIV